MENSGNRRFRRANFKVHGFIGVENGEIPVSVVNISLNGVLVCLDGDAALEHGNDYPLRISLPHSAVSIITRSCLIHEEQGRFGFRFDSVEADGMIHLRRLLELNSSSDENIEKELEFLMR